MPDSVPRVKEVYRAEHRHRKQIIALGVLRHQRMGWMGSGFANARC